MNLMAMLIFMAIVILILIMIVYRYISSVLSNIIHRQLNQYSINLLQATWRAIKIICLLWTLAFMALYMSIDSWPESRFWGLGDYYWVLPRWLRTWFIIVLPGIPGFIAIGNYIALRAVRYTLDVDNTDPENSSKQTPTVYSQRIQILGLIMACMLLIILFLVASTVPISVI